MAFDSSIVQRPIAGFGNKSISHGTFTNAGGSTGGNIDTGLRTCEFIHLQHSGAAAVASAPSVNETLPVAGSAVTIVTTADADGYWWAWGDA